MNAEKEYDNMIANCRFVMRPPTEEQRRRNEGDPEAQNKLTAGLAQVFGRWPEL